MKSYTITNGKQTVVFESMCHVGRSDYFDRVRDSIRLHKEQGFTYFYERVKPGTPEDEARFTAFTGLFNLKLAYEALARIAGLAVQPQDSFLGLVNDKDVNADISLGEVCDELERRGFKKSAKEYKLEKLDKIDPSSFSGRVFGFAIRFMIKRLSRKRAKRATPVMEAIREMRDIHLAKVIFKGPNKIIVTYGGAHFDGTFALLKAADPSWRIIDSWERSVL